MPLVNEVVIGLDDKDKFNASKPKDDAANFADYVTNPTLPALIQTLFPAAKAPTNFPRTDLLTVFLKGMKALNQPRERGAGRDAAAEHRRSLRWPSARRTRSAWRPATLPASRTAAGPADDVVDLSLRVAMGALCVLTGPSDTFGSAARPSTRRPAAWPSPTACARRRPTTARPSRT